jgi:hypothetical protein
MIATCRNRSRGTSGIDAIFAEPNGVITPLAGNDVV